MSDDATLMDRRAFLKLMLAVPCCAVLPSFLAGCLRRRGESFYVANESEYLKAFRETSKAARQYLAARFGETTATEVTREAEERFAAGLADLPDVGGKENPDTQYLVIAAWYTAYYAPLRKRGHTAEVVGRMIYDLNREGLKQKPRAEAGREGAARFTPAEYAKMRKWAEWTRKRQLPANWVAEFIQGNGEGFDFGYNYTECAICKYFHAQGTPELAPFVCLNDFLRSRTLGTGLHRTKTLAQGDALCNFRYKKSRPVTQDWSTEIPLIRKRIAEKRVCVVPKGWG